MTNDEHFMMRCLQLAELGKGRVTPNPIVGAVIVLDNKIIGEGYHEKFGDAHAEVNAVNSVNDKSVLDKATIYVSLEPCAHYGKTPPCADLLVKHNFKRVVIGCSDSFSKVCGKGIQRLRDANIDVTLGVLETKCRLVNKHFFTFHEKKRPYILLKWAQSQNGLIDSKNGSDEEITWISCTETQTLVHKWRTEHEAILVGKNTVKNDNPSLTVRAIAGKNPIRIILDSSLELSSNVEIKNDESRTIILNTIESRIDNNVEFHAIKSMDVSTILEKLYDLKIQSILIEGGKATLQSFIDSEQWDEARVITGRSHFDGGTAAPKISGTNLRSESFFKDEINYLINQ